MSTVNNGCYKRVYVGDMAGSTLTVNGKPIVNNIEGDTVVGIDKLGTLETDVFYNEFLNVDSRYVRSTLGEYENGEWVTKPAAAHDDHIRCTYTPTEINGKLEGEACANPTGDTISSFDSPLSCSKWTEPDSRLLWIRHDKDCKPVTAPNPNAARALYEQRDYQRRTYGEYDSNGKWITSPKKATCQPLTTVTVVLNTINVSDWEFTYENGVLIAREEGYTDYLEPESNTVVYKV